MQRRLVISQIFKVPQLRNMYTKVGMFGAPRVDSFDAPDSGFTGDQIRGFGFTNDGSIDAMLRFFTALVFRPQLTSGVPLFNANGTRRDTLTASNGAAAGPRIDLLEARARASTTSLVLGGVTKECDLVARVAVAGTPRLTPGALRALAATAGQEVTYTCVPPGSGARIAATN